MLRKAYVFSSKIADYIILNGGTLLYSINNTMFVFVENIVFMTLLSELLMKR